MRSMKFSINFLKNLINGLNTTIKHGPTDIANPIIDINHMKLIKLNIP